MNSSLTSLAVYQAQAAGNIVVALLLLWLRRRTPRPFLGDWGRSWVALAAYHLLAGITIQLSHGAGGDSRLRTATSAASLVAALWQLGWLARGTRAMATGRRWRRRGFYSALALLSLAAVAVTLVTVPAAPELRLFVRVGLRSLAAGGVLVLSAAFVYRRVRAPEELGPRLLAGSMFAYGATQLAYFVVFVANLFGVHVVLNYAFSGLVDLLVQLGVGLGMTVWLLEDERRAGERAAEGLAEREQRLRLLIDQLPVAVWSVDRELTITSSTGSALRGLGIEPGELVGRRLVDYLGTEDPNDLALSRHRRALAGQSVSYEGEWAGRRFQSWLEPLRNGGGEIVGVVGVGVDVTDRAELESKLRETQKLESLGVLAGGIAHDFNNLLTGISGHTELALRQLPEGSPARASLEKSLEGARRGGELARQMLAYAGRSQLAVEPIDLRRLVSEMADLLRVSISMRCVLHYNFGEDLPPVHGDATQLRQIVMNLLINASEAIGERGGAITVRGQARQVAPADAAGFTLGEELAPGAYVELTVADDGEGMPPEVRARIFEPFFTTKFTGRGLGLSAVLGIVRAHRGAIRVESKAREGTTFTLLLPAATS